jgi:hypothetical protein
MNIIETTLIKYLEGTEGLRQGDTRAEERRSEKSGKKGEEATRPSKQKNKSRQRG